MADRDIERDESKGASQARDARLRRSILRDWAAHGYWSRQHLEGLRADGEVSLLSDWRQDETYCSYSPTRPFATWLAAQDMWEIESNVRTAKLAQS